MFFKKNSENNIENTDNANDSNKEFESKSKDELYILLDEIINEFIIRKPTLVNAVERGLEDISILKKEVYEYIDLRSYNLNNNDKEFIFKDFETYIWGYGPLQGLIDSDSITDIKTIAPDNTRIKEYGIRKKCDVKFPTVDSMMQYINYVAVKNKITLSEINSIQKITDTTSSEKWILRIKIMAKYINSVPYHYLVIRKFAKANNKKSLNDLKNLGMFNDEIEQYLLSAIKSGQSIFIGGKGAVGKSILQNALIDEIDHNKSVLVIQEAEELNSNKHPDIMFQTVKESKGEGKIQYTLKDLTINALLLDLDYVVIGEIKGEEAMDMVNAIFTGHVGMASLHCSSSREAADKLLHYMRYSKNSNLMQDAELYRMLSRIDIIIFINDFKCFEITEIAGFDEDKKRLIYNPVFAYEVKKTDDVIKGEFRKLNDSCPKISNKILYSNFVKNNRNGKVV